MQQYKKNKHFKVSCWNTEPKFQHRYNRECQLREFFEDYFTGKKMHFGRTMMSAVRDAPQTVTALSEHLVL